MKFNNKTSGILAFLLLMLLGVTFFVGCDSAKESAENVMDKTEKAVDETAENVNDLADEAVENVNEELNNIVDDNRFIGTWSGKFDIRTGTMIITKQEGNDFEGKVTINLRTVINQDVKGNFDPETNKVIIKDQLRSKFKGVYSGTLSEDGTTISGNFKTNLDNKVYNFSFSKK